METSGLIRPQYVTCGVLSVLPVEIDYFYTNESSSDDNQKDKPYSGISSEK